MTPGPTLILRCPGCAGLLQCWTLASGNTFGEVGWSDGRVIAPMLPEPPSVCVCPHCRQPFRRADAAEVGQLGQFFADDEADVPITEAWTAAPSIEDADEASLLAWFEREPFLSAEDELVLRMHAWQRGNDQFRDAKAPWVPCSERPMARFNMQRVLSLLADSIEDTLARAELLRELEQFDQCVAVLSSPDVETFPAAVEIARLAREKIARLAVIWS